jgi:hypothetical protein
MQVVLNIYNFLKTTFWKNNLLEKGWTKINPDGGTNLNFKKGCNFGPPSGLILAHHRG